jgi:hypothetical protein
VYTFGCNDESALGRDTSKEGSETLPVKLNLPYKVILREESSVVFVYQGHLSTLIFRTRSLKQ